jgi:hypothetical protein
VRIECGNGSWIVTMIDHERQQKFVTHSELWSEIPLVLYTVLASPAVPWTDYKSFREKKKPPEDKKR